MATDLSTATRTAERWETPSATTAERLSRADSKTGTNPTEGVQGADSKCF